MKCKNQSMNYRSRYRHDGGLIDPSKVGPYVTKQRLVLMEELESGESLLPGRPSSPCGSPKG